MTVILAVTPVITPSSCLTIASHFGMWIDVGYFHGQMRGNVVELKQGHWLTSHDWVPGRHSTHKNGDDWGMVYDCFNHSNDFGDSS